MHRFRVMLALFHIRGVLSCLIVVLVLHTDAAIGQSINQRSEGDCSQNIVGGQNISLFLNCSQDGTIRPRGPGDAEMIAALDFIDRGNLRLAAQYSETALKIWSDLPNRNDPAIKNKMAAAHSVVGLGLAVMGATARDRSIGCSRLLRARQLYVETGNSVGIAKADDDMRFGGCSLAP